MTAIEKCCLNSWSNVSTLLSSSSGVSIPLEVFCVSPPRVNRMTMGFYSDLGTRERRLKGAIEIEARCLSPPIITRLAFGPARRTNKVCKNDDVASKTDIRGIP